MPIKKKQLAKGMHVNHLVLSRDGRHAVGHMLPGLQTTALCVVDLEKGTERRVTLEPPLSRVASANFLGSDLVVAALEDRKGKSEEHTWSLLVIDPSGQVTASRVVTKGKISGALAVGPQGQIALLVSTTLFLWKPDELKKGKAPQKLEVPVLANAMSHLVWSDAGELIALGRDCVLVWSPALKLRRIPLPGIEPDGSLSCTGNTVAFHGSNDTEFELMILVDLKTGRVTTCPNWLFNSAQLSNGMLLGASGGKTWLKKLGWRGAEREPVLQQGYVMRLGLDGAQKDVVAVKLGRVDACVGAGSVVLIGTHQGITWYSGVFAGS